MARSFTRAVLLYSFATLATKIKYGVISRQREVILILWLFRVYFLYIMRNGILPLRVMYCLYTPLEAPICRWEPAFKCQPEWRIRPNIHHATKTPSCVWIGGIYQTQSVTQPPSCALNAITAHHPHQHTRIHGWTGGYPSVSPFSPSGPRSSLVM